MLTSPTITAFLPTVKPKQAKEFYSNILGLKLISEDNYAIVYEGNGVTLRITIVDAFSAHPFTVLGFEVTEIESQVKSLIDKGVEFERYPTLVQDENGIWTAPSKAKIAWFKDPEGNLLSIIEHGC